VSPARISSSHFVRWCIGTSTDNRGQTRFRAYALLITYGSATLHRCIYASGCASMASFTRSNPVFWGYRETRVSQLMYFGSSLTTGLARVVHIGARRVRNDLRTPVGFSVAVSSGILDTRSASAYLIALSKVLFESVLGSTTVFPECSYSACSASEWVSIESACTRIRCQDLDGRSLA
jgi:hypothetical protein